jgi:spermidine synthase
VVPRLGLVRGALAFGLLNALVALWTTWLFREELAQRLAQRLACGGAIALLGLGLVYGQKLTDTLDASLYADEVILARTTPYQRIVVTKWKDDYRLHLNSHLQFSSRDEYRYHEALVHPGLASLAGAKHALVLGGGDGLAVREMLKYPALESIALVDLDPEMTTLFRTHPLLTKLNANSLNAPRVHIINADAFPWLEKNDGMFDFAVVDFPDPNNYSLGKLYTTAFYRLLKQHIAARGLIVVQSTSPMFARQSYWCIVETLKQAGWRTWPYHAYVPAFGEWGFVLAGQEQWRMPERLPAGLRYLDMKTLPALFDFAPDMGPVAAEPNRLNDQSLVRYYEQEWRAIVH